MLPIQRWVCDALGDLSACVRFSGTTRFQYTIYEHLEGRESYCYGCDARVEAVDDRIKVSAATSPVTILKYHYIDTLRVEPSSIKIGPIRLLDDPVPFIRVENGRQRRFEVFNP